MKKLAVLVVIATMIFFIGGGLSAFTVFFLSTTMAGIVGGIASTIGLLAFVSPRLTSSDIQNVEGELIAKLATAAKSVDEYEKKISTNKEAMERLERDRCHIELLVRQASVKVFLEEKLRSLSEAIEQRILSDNILSEHLIDYSKTKGRVTELEGEISSSAHAELIFDIIGEVQPRNRKIFVHVFGTQVDIFPLIQILDRAASKIIRFP